MISAHTPGHSMVVIARTADRGGKLPGAARLEGGRSRGNGDFGDRRRYLPGHAVEVLGVGDEVGDCGLAGKRRVVDCRCFVRISTGCHRDLLAAHWGCYGGPVYCRSPSLRRNFAAGDVGAAANAVAIAVDGDGAAGGGDRATGNADAGSGADTVTAAVFHINRAAGCLDDAAADADAGSSVDAIAVSTINVISGFT